MFCDQASVGGSIFLRKAPDSTDDKGRFRAVGGVRLSTIHVNGNLDCSGGSFDAGGKGNALFADGAEIKGSVSLNAAFTAKGCVSLSNASIGNNLHCNGGHFEGEITRNKDGTEQHGTALSINQTAIGEGVFLNEDFRSDGAVSLILVRVGASLTLDGGTFEGGQQGAILLDRIDVRNSLYLRKVPKVKGYVSLVGSSIAGDLDCSGGQFLAWNLKPTPGQDDLQNTKDTWALIGQQMRVGGSLWLGEGFKAQGTVNLLGASIGHDLKCQKGTFEAGNSEAFNCERCRVEGIFEFTALAGFSGAIRLGAAHANVLVDDVDSWRGVSEAHLDGFRYERFGGEAPTDAKARIDWLNKQPRTDLCKKFKPQPWEQVIKALRDSGHASAATEVAIEKQRLQGHQRGRWGRLTSGLYGALYGYGYRPGLFFRWLIVLFVVLMAVFFVAGRYDLMAPADWKIVADSKYADCRARNWTECEALKAYPAFNPALYSLDLILPVVDLEQVKNWWPSTERPLGLTLQIVAQIGKLIGWISLGVFTAVVSGLISKD